MADHIAIPRHVAWLALFPDNDIAGEIGATNATRACVMRGRAIETEFTSIAFNDWNDVLSFGRGGSEEASKLWRQTLKQANRLVVGKWV